ncbi:hypothetical protein LT337_06615 [Mycolicibacterium fortuitum]|nr:hypothetical protein LT337_06615 [Mycolicibacterium fortuitum]
MGNFVKTATAGAMLGGSLMFTVGMGIANAAPETAGDGKVNLTLGNVSVLENVDDAAAAQIAAGVCENTDTASLTTAVQGVDANSTEHVVCTNNLGTISFSQNGTTERPAGPPPRARHRTAWRRRRLRWRREAAIRRPTPAPAKGLPRRSPLAPDPRAVILRASPAVTAGYRFGRDMAADLAGCVYGGQL